MDGVDHRAGKVGRDGRAADARCYALRAALVPRTAFVGVGMSARRAKAAA